MGANACKFRVDIRPKSIHRKNSMSVSDSVLKNNQGANLSVQKK